MLFEAQDDVAEISESGGAFEIRQQTWKLMADVSDYHPACASVLEGLFEGLAAGCGRHIPVHLKPYGRRQGAVRLVDRLKRRFACNLAGPHCALRTWNRAAAMVGKRPCASGALEYGARGSMKCPISASPKFP